MRKVLQLILPVSIMLAAGSFSPRPLPSQSPVLCQSPIPGQSPQPVPGQPWTLPLPDSKHLGMAWVGKGSFLMGSPSSEPGRKEDEGPQMTVTLTKGYWMGRTEVTIGQWKAVMHTTMREKVLNLLNDTTPVDIEGKRQVLRDFMHFKRDDPDGIIAGENDSIPMYFVMDRVNRGGSWGSGANDSRSANRAKNPPAEMSAYRGFRLALCPVQ